MFGFVKELMLIGTVSYAVGKTVEKYCGHNYIKELSVRQQNTIAEETIKIVEQAQGIKIKEVDDSNFDDLMVVGFLTLANEFGSNQYFKHQLVLIGLMIFLQESLQKGVVVSHPILSSARTYLEGHQMG